MRISIRPAGADIVRAARIRRIRGAFGSVAVVLVCLAVSVLAQTGNTSDPLQRTTPSWFDEAKLGVFIHWSVGSIPAYAPVVPHSRTPITSLEAFVAERERRTQAAKDAGGASSESVDVASWLAKSPFTEWYALSMLVPGSATARYHKEHYGDLPYARLVERFRDEVIPGWNPAPWADLFSNAGARYVVFTTRLDDGFLMWPSAHPNPHRSHWQSTRDVVGELSTALRARGMRTGFYYAGGVDFTFSGLPMDTSAPQPPKILAEMLWGKPTTDAQRAYVNTHWRELIERYKPDVMWNDYFYPGSSLPSMFTGKPDPKLDPEFKNHVEDLFRFYLTRVPQGVINNRFSIVHQSAGDLYTDFVTPEYSTDPDGLLGRPKGSSVKWESNRGLGTAYAYNRLEDDRSYMSSAELVRMFVDIVARGGNLLINVGPMSTGEIPWPQAKRLIDLGWWLKTNGNAIYGTRPWERVEGTTGEGEEVRYTASKDAVFAIVLGTPKSRTVELELQLDQGVKVTLEGTSRDLKWTATATGVRIDLPATPDERPAMTLRFSPKTGVRPL